MLQDYIIRTCADAQRCVALDWTQAQDRRFVVEMAGDITAVAPDPAGPAEVWMHVRIQWVLLGLLYIFVAVAVAWPHRGALLERAQRIRRGEC